MSEGTETPAKPLSVYQVIVTMVDQMASIAWQKLGLQPDLMTGQVAEDLTEAKVAIDLTTHLASFVEKDLDDDDKRELHNLITNLRMNYVNKVKESNG